MPLFVSDGAKSCTPTQVRMEERVECVVYVRTGDHYLLGVGRLCWVCDFYCEGEEENE